MKLQKYINWLDSSVRFGSPMTKDSLQQIRDALIEIQKTYYVEDELFAKKRNFFTEDSLDKQKDLFE